MKIHQFSQQGKRSNNEDSLGISNALLTVCDGMGGHNYGERASAFVKDAMLQAFPDIQPLGKMEIQEQLSQVQNNLNQLLEKEPELEKMGTTFTGVFRTPDVWYAAHIGDSRIYLFRPSEQKLWHTWDHSLVGELMRTHEITIEAGRFHFLSNRISKAIIAQKEGKTASASIAKIDELKEGDILLLCSDGVVEGWGDWELVQLFSDDSLSFEQKCEKLAQQCNEKSKDNNTAIIAEIEAQDAFAFGSNEELEWTSFAAVEADYQAYLKEQSEEEEEDEDVASMPEAVPVPSVPANPVPAQSGAAAPPPSAKPKEKRNGKLWIAMAVALVILAVIAVCLFKFGCFTKSQPAETPRQEVPVKHNVSTSSKHKQKKERNATGVTDKSATNASTATRENTSANNARVNGTQMKRLQETMQNESQDPTSSEPSKPDTTHQN